MQLVIATGFIPLSRQWLCEKAASGLERILCGVPVKRTTGKHGRAMADAIKPKES